MVAARRPAAAATRRVAASRTGPLRREVCSATTGAGAPVGRAEGLGEAFDARHVGAAEAVDRLVGVADRDQVATAARKQPEQLDLRGVGVLQLVDEDHRAGLALAGQQRGVADPEADDRADQLGRVVGGGLAQRRHLAVLPHEARRGPPVRRARARAPAG